MRNSVLLNATEISGNYPVTECSRHSEQNLQFLFIICITSNGALSAHPLEKVKFLFQMLRSLAGMSSAQCNHRILGADHRVFQTPQPWQKPWISLSHVFHVVLRRKLAIWQWLLLNVLHTQAARLHSGSQRGTKMSRLC